MIPYRAFFVITTVLIIRDIEAKTFGIPGCHDRGIKCENYSNRIPQAPGKLVTMLTGTCPTDANKFMHKCDQRKVAGCIATPCNAKTGNRPPSNMQCSSVIAEDESDPDYQHSVNTFQESCSLDGISDSDDGEISVCCQPDATDGILLAGYGAESHEFPHQALLIIKSSSDDSSADQRYISSQCGATIYNEKWIITASHCVVNKKVNAETNYTVPMTADQVEILVGTNVASAGLPSKRYRVKRVIVHEGYSVLLQNQDEAQKRRGRGDDSKHIYNDIALLEIYEPIKFSKYVRALRIAPKDFDPSYYADKVVIAGWGTTDDLETTDHLQKSYFPLRMPGSSGCTQYGSAYKPEQHLCVGGIVGSSYGGTAGGGDSGGPAICRDQNGKAVLCGVTSFGGDDKDCRDNQNADNCPPSIYASVPYFYDWIQRNAGAQNTGQTMFHDVTLLGETANNDRSQVKITSSDANSCGGTLVSSDTVVTAAHCIFNVDQNGNLTQRPSLKVRAYSNSYPIKSLALMSPSGKQELITRNGRFYRKFKKIGMQTVLESPYYVSDVAIIKLMSPVAGGTPVPPSSSTPLDGSMVQEMAWMRNETQGLRRYENKILNRDNCEARFNRLTIKDTFNFNLGNTEMCIVEKYSGGSLCDRDVGGGVICNESGTRTLCGIQTFRLCTFSLPKVIVDVSKFASTITQFANAK